MKTVKITKLDTEAVGVARIDNRTILIDKVLPSEEVEITSIEDKGKYDVAKEYQVITAITDRVAPLCPYYGQCGGCQLQHASASYQQQFKVQKVKDAFHYVAGIDIDISDYTDSPSSYHYRNKSVFVVQNGNCGMYRTRSHDFLAVDSCAIACPEINQFYAILRPWVETDGKSLNHVAIRYIDGKYLCVLVGKGCPNVDGLIDVLDAHYKGLYQLVFNCNDAKKDIISGSIKILHGDDIIVSFGNITMPISADSFVQVNNDVSAQIYSDVANMVAARVVINAYSGAGLLTAILSQSSEVVYGVEIVRNAHLNAEELKESNNISNMINICGDALRVLPDIISQHKDMTLVIDPPRKGVDNRLLEYINNADNIKEIIYISCDPNSLAKNYAKLTNYSISSVKLYNIFPQTHHIETVVELRRK